MFTSSVLWHKHTFEQLKAQFFSGLPVVSRAELPQCFFKEEQICYKMAH